MFIVRNLVGSLGIFIMIFGITLYDEDNSNYADNGDTLVLFGFIIFSVGVLISKNKRRLGIGFLLFISGFFVYYYCKINNSFDSFYNVSYLLWLLALVLPLIKTTKVHKERKPFSNDVKRQVLQKQGHLCAKCGQLLNVVDYDHMDGDRSNNDISNCQALCPNCHAIKSRAGKS